MMTNKEPIYYAKAACDSIMHRYMAEELPPRGHFHYHQGVFLSGMYECFKLCGEQKYFDYMREWVDSVVSPQGEIHEFCNEWLDDIQPGILLFPLMEKTNDTRYEKALLKLMKVLKAFPRNKMGGFWHKYECSNEMWLDGLYMSGPIRMMHAAKYGDSAEAEDVVKQALLLYDKTKDEKTGLLYQAWDCEGKSYWAEHEEAHSPQFWSRSIGWFLTAALDILYYLPREHHLRGKLAGAFASAAEAAAHYQDGESGMWYQVTDRGGDENNWLESSGTALFSYALMRGAREGFLPPQYTEIGQAGYEGLIKRLKTDESGNLVLGGICAGTCIGDYDYYIGRPSSENDLHGMGAFLLMCCEAEKNKGKD